MYNILDGLINQNVFDVNVVDGIPGSGLEGSWVAPKAVGTDTKYDFAANAFKAFAVVSESSKDGKPGLSQDTVYWKRVAVVGGHYRAETDVFEGTAPVVGDLLKTNASGKLEVAGVSDNAVAYVLKAPSSKEYLGRTISVIEIQTL